MTASVQLPFGSPCGSFRWPITRVEEFPQFTNCARRYAGTKFYDARPSNDSLNRNHWGTARATRDVVLFQSHGDVSFFYDRIHAGSLLQDFVYAGPTAAFGVYCPGLITALVLYPPLLFSLAVGPSTKDL